MHKERIMHADHVVQPASMPVSLGTTVSADEFRHVMKGCASTVVIVTTATDDHQPYAMTANSFTSVSLDPPTVLVCVNKEASLYDPLMRQARFCINILHLAHSDLALACSSRDQAQQRFAYHNWRFDSASGLPYLADAQATLFCTSREHLEVATHVVIIGDVRIAKRHTEIAPLLYGGGRYGQLR